MSDAQKETIIIVHGTWAAPNAGAVKWYQPSRDTATARQEFVAKLDLALEKRGSPARCWAHCQDTSRIYCWSGHNAWIERIHASTELASSVNRLQSEGWRVHIIAHSHGGNVAVEALPALKGTAANPSDISGTITTLGTPFMDVMSPNAKRLDRRHRIYEFVFWPSYLVLFLVMVLVIYGAAVWMGVDSYYSFYQFAVRNYFLFGVLAGLFSIGLFSLVRDRRRGGWRKYWDDLATAKPTRVFMLSMGSRMDETWQLLHHLRNIESPLSPKFGFLRYVLDSWREYLRKSCEVERIHGAALFREQPRATKIAAVMLLVSLLALAVFVAIGWAMGSFPASDFLYWSEFQREQGKQPSVELNALISEDRRLIQTDKAAWLKNRDLLKKTVDEEIGKLPPEEESKWRVYKESKQRTEDLVAVLVGGGFWLLVWIGLVSTVTFYFGRSSTPLFGHPSAGLDGKSER